MCKGTKKCPHVQVAWSPERQQGNELGQEVKAKGKAGLESRVLCGGTWARGGAYWGALWLPGKICWVITKVVCGLQEQ